MSKDIRGRLARGQVEQKTDAGRRAEVENGIQILKNKIEVLGGELVELKSSVKSTKSLFQDCEKDSDDHKATERHLEKLETEADQKEAHLKDLRKKLKVRRTELSKLIEAYAVGVTTDLGVGCKNEMISTLRNAAGDAEAAAASYNAELDAIGKRYGAEMVNDARKVIDSAMQVVGKVQKLLAKA